MSVQPLGGVIVAAAPCAVEPMETCMSMRSPETTPAGFVRVSDVGPATGRNATRCPVHDPALPLDAERVPVAPGVERGSSAASEVIASGPAEVVCHRSDMPPGALTLPP
jgi:hypothetical protein